MVFDLTLTHHRWGDTDDPSKMGKLRHPTSINKPLQEAARERPAKYLSDYANNRYISFLSAVFSTSGRIDAEFRRMLFFHAHRESEEFFRLTGQLAQPNQDYVFSKRAAFFNSLKNKVGHIMARASALRVNLNLQPSAPSLPRPSARNKHAHHLYALNLSHHILFLNKAHRQSKPHPSSLPRRMSARLDPSSGHLPSLFVALLSLLVSPRPSPPWVIIG